MWAKTIKKNNNNNNNNFKRKQRGRGCVACVCAVNGAWARGVRRVGVLCAACGRARAGVCMCVRARAGVCACARVAMGVGAGVGVGPGVFFLKKKFLLWIIVF